MTEYKRYSEYKDSGVEWLGAIPSNWNKGKIGKLVTIINGYPFDSKLFNNEEKGVPLIRIRDIKSPIPETFTMESAPERITIQKNDILIGMDGDFNHTLWDRDNNGVLNQRVCSLRTDNTLLSRWIDYVIAYPLLFINERTFSTTVKHLSSKEVYSITIPLPSSETQHKIVEFLDRETAHIDAGIANMESLIALLAEKRAALISETVTRGIPGEHTEFKDSGVAWLGEIPAGWNTADPKVLFSPKAIQSFPEDTHLMASQKYGVIPQADYLQNTGKRVVEVFSKDAKFKHIDKDDFLIHLRSFQGGIEHCVNTGKVTTAYTVVSPNLQKIFPLYAKYLLKSKDYISGLASTTNQLRDGQSIKWKDFRKVVLPVPSLDEQKKIADFLKKELKSLELISHEVQATIQLMKEKRQTLISDVVTGKIDVTNSIN